VFIIDLPRLQGNQKTIPEEITPFGRELLHFLRTMEMEEAVVDSILNFDFSRTSHLAFIHSM
jgi:Tyrosyl-DNA phosphodiesterase